ncbi:DNA repair protein RadC [bacterium]|nr:DNA repair protein RadC [bacterium]
MEELARAVETPLPEINTVLGAFTGADPEAARDAEVCAVKPRCQQCPVNSHCAYFRYTAKDQNGESRNLIATTRKEDRPREKFEREGGDALGEAELLAILLRTGSGRENAVDLAARLLREAGTLDRLAAMSIAEISRIHGLGRVKAITIKAALELARRLRETSGAEDGAIRSAADVFARLRPRFVGAKKEEFLALLLNTKNEITRIVPISKGTLNQSLVHPREAFTEAVRDTAHAVIFAHNHPSGDPTPSRDDFAVTNRLVKAGDIVGVRVLDHIVIGAETYYSFADEGKLRE